MGNQEQSFCSTCRELTWRPAFFRLLGSNYSQDVGPLRQVQARRHSCSLCGYLSDVLEASYGAEALHKVLEIESDPLVGLHQDALDLSIDPYFDKAVFTKPLACALQVTIRGMQNSSYDVLYQRQYGITDLEKESIHLLAFRKGLDGAKDTPAYGRALDPTTVDWLAIRRWMDVCRSAHPGSEGRPMDRQGDLQLLVIDIENRCVTPLPTGAEYLALSYVWGKDQRLKLVKGNHDQLTSPGSMNTESGCPSRTILHAMEATKALGHRYIWVDALCIVQDDAESLAMHVRNMDRVYEDARLTLVAAAGIDADHGLPGLSPDVPRTVQQIKLVAEGITVATRLPTNLKMTKWDSRGWTYQEKLLSGKVLYFTESQVLYHCDRDCNFQEQFQGHRNDFCFTLLNLTPRLDFETENLFQIYVTALEDFTRRSLTSPLDRIRAFGGVLSRLEGPLRGPSFFGLPCSIFDAALLWYPAGPTQRGPEVFPSWSWAGWTDGVRYSIDPGIGLLSFCERTVSQCTITAELSPTLTVELSRPTSPSLITEESRPGLPGAENEWHRRVDDESGEIYYVTREKSGRTDYELRYPRPLPSTMSTLIKEVLIGREGSKYLHVRGNCAEFRITAQHSGFAGNLFSTCNRGRHDRCNLAVLDANSKVAGMVLVPGRLVPQLQEQNIHQFVALSRTTLWAIDEDPTWDPDTSSYKPWPASDDDLYVDDGESEDHEIEEYATKFRDWHFENNIDDEGCLISEPVPPDTSRPAVFLADNDTLENREPFDRRHYSARRPWPLLNVLLLSSSSSREGGNVVDGTGVVERVGIGQIHVDAFRRVAVERELRLG